MSARPRSRLEGPRVRQEQCVGLRLFRESMSAPVRKPASGSRDAAAVCPSAPPERSGSGHG
ncbi:hypothetical protein FM106_08675 [Brachybacterium faecium]|nr:hypothetical protein FM106_08675 [Brachybacterium faecium]